MRRTNTPQSSLLNLFVRIFSRIYHWLIALLHGPSRPTSIPLTEINNTPVIAESPIKNSEIFIDIESSLFNKLDQTVLTNPSNYYYLKLDESFNELNVQPGVSFLAYCNSTEFHESILPTPVVISKGFYTDSNGLFTLNEELWELICPKCKQPISGNNAQGIGFRQCSVQIKYRDVNRVTGAFMVTAPNNIFAFAKISQSGNVRYNYVKFQLEM